MSSAILVPLDGSPLAEQALPYAERLAEAISARLVLCRVVPVHARQPAELDLAPGDEARAYVERVAARLISDGHVVATTTPWGEPASEILAQVEAAQAALVVMATHARSGPGRLLFGSVADEVLRHAAVPIVLVPHGSGPSWPADRALRVVVPLDGSELGEAALAPARELAARLGAEIILLQVIPSPPSSFYVDATAYVPAFDTDTELTDARRYLAQIGERLLPSINQVRVRVEIGQPAVVISQVAAEEKANLIAMATHGRSGLARLVLGSVATATIQRATVPVLLIRPAVLRTPPTPTPSEANLPARGSAS